MIYWLIQSSTAHPDLARGVPPADFLNDEEEHRLAGFKTEKRRQDWLLGRWTAKHLVQSVLKETTGQEPAFTAITVRNGRNGDPLVLINDNPAMSLSISHSNGYAFCAVVQQQSWPIGADIEHVEPRSSTFVGDYFTDDEITRVSQVRGQARDMLVNAIWSAKEATLKALRVGLSVDTRTVSCLIEPPAKPPHAWTPFAIRWHPRRLNRPAPPLMGWWQALDGHVLTLAAQQPAANTGSLV